VRYNTDQGGSAGVIAAFFAWMRFDGAFSL
jgi:hypothetical protein